MSAADPMAALAAYLLSTDAGTAAGERVFRPQLPTGENKLMPRACIVIRRGGGYMLTGGSNTPVGDPRLDIFSYGETWLEADLLAGEVVVALRALRDELQEHTFLYWARISAGPMPFISPDPSTEWPCVLVSAQVAHREAAIA